MRLRAKKTRQSKSENRVAIQSERKWLKPFAESHACVAIGCDLAAASQIRYGQSSLFAGFLRWCGYRRGAVICASVCRVS
jgi:hypothetical protein